MIDPVFDDNRSVWTRGAPVAPPASPLDRDLDVDVAIVGGGFTGVSTAYHLARRFPDRGIALLEARALANGASGRNGGLMLNGVTFGDHPPERLAREHALTRGAIDALVALIGELGLAVRHRRDGCLRITTSQRGAEETHAQVEALAALGAPLRFVPASALRARGATGAVLDPTEGMLNGVDLIRALRPHVEAAGVRIFEATPVTRIREGATVELATPRAVVRARAIVLATNGYTPRLGYFRTGILPVISHVIATDPLPRDLLDRIGLGEVAGFSDDLPRLAYASVDPDGRLIFGGGSNRSYDYQFGNRTSYDARLDDAPARAIRDTMLGYFPELEGVAIRHRWSGPLGLTIPRHCAIGVMGAARNVYYALGYSGHGVVMANLAGRILTDLYAGDRDAWRGHAFCDLRPRGIPPEPLRWLGYHAYTRATGRSPFKRLG